MVQKVEEFRAELNVSGLPKNPTFVSFTSEKSQLSKPGPRRMLRPESPRRPV